MMETANVTTTDVPVVPGMRLETLKLIDTLKGGTAGETKTDAELAKVCGKETGVGQAGYAYLMSAIRHVLNNHQKVWQRIAGANCIKCLGVEGALGCVDADRRSMYKRAKRAAKKLTAVEPMATPEERKDINNRLATHGGVLVLMDSRTHKKLAVRDVAGKPDPAKLLEALVKTA
jgi:hypothetical protein